LTIDSECKDETQDDEEDEHDADCIIIKRKILAESNCEYRTGQNEGKQSADKTADQENGVLLARHPMVEAVEYEIVNGYFAEDDGDTGENLGEGLVAGEVKKTARGFEDIERYHAQYAHVTISSFHWTYLNMTGGERRPVGLEASG